jgi:predicted ATPase/DNA-binding NarL/FixJ family response regulator
MSGPSLPSLSTPFFGRDAELAKIRHWLGDPACRLLSLVGLGGIGKTRLVIEAARQNADRFPEGVFFVPLQSLELPDLLLPAIVEAARLPSSPGMDLRQQLVGFLVEKRRLLVLDSFEHLLSGIDVIVDLLQSAPAVKFVITSREKLNIQEEIVLRVGALTYPEDGDTDNPVHYSAVALFINLLRRLEPDLVITPHTLNSASVICRQVRGMPLAIELAVGWADTLSLDEIAQEIARSIDFLETRRRDCPDRHRNVRAVLDPTLQALPDADCAVLKKLCVFRSSFTREAAEAVAGATLPSLALLVNKSLVRRNLSSRYEIHELVRQYGESLLNNVPGQRRQAQARHAAYYADFLEARWQEMKAALRNESFERIDFEITNITIALQFMIENGAIAQIEQSMNALCIYFAMRSRFSEGALWFGKSVSALRASQDETMLGSLLVRQAFFLACLSTFGETDEAVRVAEEGLALLAHHQDQVTAETLIVADLCSAFIYWFAGDSQRMKDSAQRGFDCATEANHPFGIRSTMCLLAKAESRSGNYARAKDIGYACYELALHQEDAWIQGITALHALAEVAYVQHEHEEAQRWCQIAYQCFEDLHEPWTLATTRLMLTICAVALRDFAGAQNHLNACLRLFEESGLMWQIPPMLLRVAQLLAEQQMIDYAVAVLALVVDHPACRTVTYGEAIGLIDQLRQTLSGERFSAAWACGQALPPAQALEALASVHRHRSRRSAPAGALSAREVDVLRLMADGLSNAEIAERLCLSISTVKVHTRHIYDKLGVSSRTQATVNAQKQGIL